MPFLYSSTVVSSFDKLNCHEFSKIWPTPGYWSQKINICLTYKHASLSDCYYSNQHETLLLFRRCVCSTDLQQLWTWQQKQQHISVYLVFGGSYQPEQSISLLFSVALLFLWFHWIQYICALDKKLESAREVLVGWPSVVNSKLKITSKKMHFNKKN